MLHLIVSASFRANLKRKKKNYMFLKKTLLNLLPGKGGQLMEYIILLQALLAINAEKENVFK